MDELYLPDECWESVFKFIIEDKTCLKSLSLVSKQFFSITNRLRFSLSIHYPTRLLLRRLSLRFPNLTSLDLSCYYGVGVGDLDALLREISRFPFKLTSLNLSNKQLTFPSDGLRYFSQNITTLTSLSCHDVKGSDLFLIAECFPLLEELDLGDCNWQYDEISNFLEGMETLSFKLSKLRKVNLLSHDYIGDKIIFQLFKNNKFLEYAHVSTRYHDIVTMEGMSFSDEFLATIAMKGHPLTRIVLQRCVGYSYVGIFCLLYKCQSTIQHLNLSETKFLTDLDVAELSSLFLRDLVSINLSCCDMLTDSTLFELVRNCPSLRDMDMGSLCIETDLESLEEEEFVVKHHQLKSLRFDWSSFLQNENQDIIRLASIFPNLEWLDLSYWRHNAIISEQGIGQVLMKCCNITHLELDFYSNVRHLGLVNNFELVKLEVLNLSYTATDDETLYQISKSCYGLLRLILRSCGGVTNMGVKRVIQSCTQLREIDLKDCNKLDASIVAWMVVSRPSLRKIITSPDIHFSDKERKHFLCHGCHVHPCDGCFCCF